MWAVDDVVGVRQAGHRDSKFFLLGAGASNKKISFPPIISWCGEGRALRGVRKVLGMRRGFFQVICPLSYPIPQN